ncbi:hypothetical protein JKF63_03917 [Porcisia hertigi]|uniref:Uncharacterized protein n=1 Tax=Porcisia hertigi TaxID=2761500 RepID=A0A836HCN3_9TRYP|nr:hypothetical protein JKF63_03917 [Porcisia hertigi]
MQHEPIQVNYYYGETPEYNGRGYQAHLNSHERPVTAIVASQEPGFGHVLPWTRESAPPSDSEPIVYGEATYIARPSPINDLSHQPTHTNPVPEREDKL